MMRIHHKRIYDPFESTDGHRVLVDRIWPRGMTREAAKIDEWFKEIGPSNELRKLFAHRADRWEEFQERYRLELSAPTSLDFLKKLLDVVRVTPLTLLYSARDELHNQASVIVAVLEEMKRAKPEGRD